MLHFIHTEGSLNPSALVKGFLIQQMSRLWQGHFKTLIMFCLSIFFFYSFRYLEIELPGTDLLWFIITFSLRSQTDGHQFSDTKKNLLLCQLHQVCQVLKQQISPDNFVPPTLRYCYYHVFFFEMLLPKCTIPKMLSFYPM